MKDLEKIKSEDLGCQVQDANPGNFAIEQEVAQLVGATVPQPTQPSADDARELGAQLLVFLRRALLPIRSALRTAVAAIYAHLDSRCTDYTPAAYAPYQPLPSYDPMGTPPTPRTLPNLLTALTAFSPRKISNGSAPSDGIPDGMSLARLVGGDYASVTKLIDDTKGWHWSKVLTDIFPNADEMVLGCTSMTDGVVLYTNTHAGASVHLSAFKTANQNSNTYNPIRVEKIYLDVFERGWFRLSGSASYANGVTKYLYIGCKGKPTDTIGIYNFNYDNSGSATPSGVPVTDIEIPQGARQGLIISNSTIVFWPALTRENVRAHIIDRLADNSDGATITIQLGNILDKLTAEDIAVATNKNYNLKRF